MDRFLFNDILYIIVFLTAITPMTFTFSANILPVSFAWILVVFITRKGRIDSSIVIVLSIWFVINLLALLRFSGLVSQLPRGFFLQTVNIILPYMIISILGANLFINFEKLFYRLSLLSLPLFALETFYKPIFYRIAPFFRSVTDVEMRAAGGWYGGFYTFNAWASKALPRNSGFMWEPGGFAFILIISIIVRFAVNGFKIDKHVVVYLACIATTMSTTGYLVGLFLILVYFTKQAKYVFPIFVIPLLMLTFYTQLWNASFLGPKIQSFVEQRDTVSRSNAFTGGRARVNRIGAFTYAAEESIRNPFGYGVFPAQGYLNEFGESISGPNTFAALLLKWGWIGVIIFVFSVYKFVRVVFSSESKLTISLFTISLLMIAFSNTLDRNVFLLCLLFYPFVVGNRRAQQRI